MPTLRVHPTDQEPARVTPRQAAEYRDEPTLAQRIHELEQRLRQAQDRTYQQKKRAALWRERALAAELESRRQHARAELWKTRALKVTELYSATPPQTRRTIA